MNALRCSWYQVGLRVTQLEFPFILYSSMVLAGVLMSTGFFMHDVLMCSV